MRPVEELSRSAAAGALEWLRETKPGAGWVIGYEADGFPASAWILHAMYETATLPSGLSHDEERRIEEAAGTRPDIPEGGVNIAHGMLIGNPLGPSSRPDGEWERLRWAALAARMNVDPFTAQPGYESFQFDSWPTNIRPPAEGSLDREQFTSLLDHLAAASATGRRTRCLSLHTAAATGDYDSDPPRIYECDLDELQSRYDESRAGSPSNFWSQERSWFVWTCPDLWGTKVSGEEDLIVQLQDDNALEARTLAV